MPSPPLLPVENDAEAPKPKRHVVGQWRRGHVAEGPIDPMDDHDSQGVQPRRRAVDVLIEALAAMTARDDLAEWRKPADH